MGVARAWRGKRGGQEGPWNGLGWCSDKSSSTRANNKVNNGRSSHFLKRIDCVQKPPVDAWMCALKQCITHTGQMVLELFVYEMKDLLQLSERSVSVRSCCRGPTGPSSPHPSAVPPDPSTSPSSCWHLLPRSKRTPRVNITTALFVWRPPVSPIHLGCSPGRAVPFVTSCTKSLL